MDFNQFQPNVAFHMETIHLICLENQTTGFSMKCNTELKWVLKPGFFPCDFLYHKIRLQIEFFSKVSK